MVHWGGENNKQKINIVKEKIHLNQDLKGTVLKSNLLRIIQDFTIKENAYNEHIIKPFTNIPTPPRQRGTVCLKMPADKTKV